MKKIMIAILLLISLFTFACTNDPGVLQHFASGVLNKSAVFLSTPPIHVASENSANLDLFELKTNPLGAKPVDGKPPNYLHLELQVPLYPQETKDTCWAASIRAAFDHQGIIASECDIVTISKGDCDELKNLSATPLEIIISPFKFFNFLRGHNISFVRAQVIASSSYALAREISQGRPILVGLAPKQQNTTYGPKNLRGHAVLLTGVTFSYLSNHASSENTSNNNEPPEIALYSITVSDPWKNSGVYVMSASEFRSRIQFSYAIDVFNF